MWRVPGAGGPGFRIMWHMIEHASPRQSPLKRFITAIARTEPPAVVVPDTHGLDEIAVMLHEIGMALLEVNQPTQLVVSRLQEIAPRYTTAPVRVVALPTVLLIQVGSDAHEIDMSTTLSLQLDKAGRIDDIAAQAAVGGITPTDAIAAVRQARATGPRFGPLTTMVGYVLATLGFALVIHPTWVSLPPHALLGFVVAAILQLSRRYPALTPVVPVIAAAVTAALANWFVADAAHESLLMVISPALVAMLPGVSLTVAAVELAGGQIIAGASRGVYAVAQLALLAFGAIQALHLEPEGTDQVISGQLIPGALFIAIPVMALGLYVYLSAPRGSLVWLIAAIGVALVGRTVAETFLPSSHAGFVGALLIVPFAMLAARIKTAPPAMVMLLATFFALVPGALSLTSVADAAEGHTGITGIAVAGSAVLSLALGTMVGWSIVQAVQGAARRGTVTDRQLAVSR